MKCCTKCKVVKNIEDFPKRENRCKDCRNLYYKVFKENNSEGLKKYREEYRENNQELLKEKRNIYYNDNQELLKLKSSKYRDENREVINSKKREYYKKKETKEKVNIYIKSRKENDSLFKTLSNIRSLIRKSIKYGGYSKRSKTYEILGCSFDEFKIYFESKFENWMNWDNNGLYNGEYNVTWQFDHIIPISIAKTEEDLIRLNHYTNFQPLCSRKNLEKSNAVYS